MEDQRSPPPLMFLGPIDSDKLIRAMNVASGSPCCIFSVTPLLQAEQLMRLPDSAPFAARFSVTADACDAIVQYAVASPTLSYIIIEDAYILKDLSRCVALLSFHGRQVLIVSEDRTIGLEMIPTIVAAMSHCIVYHCAPTCHGCSTPASAIVSSATPTLTNSPPQRKERYVPLCYDCFRKERRKREVVAATPPPTSIRTRASSTEVNRTP